MHLLGVNNDKEKIIMGFLYLLRQLFEIQLYQV